MTQFRDSYTLHPVARCLQSSWPTSSRLKRDFRGGDESLPCISDLANKAHQEEARFTVAEALRTSAFWLLTIGTGLRIVTLSAITVHYVPIMVWKGLSQQRAAFLLAAQALLALPTHILFGWIAERVNKPRLMAVAMLIAVVAILFLLYGEEEWQLWFFIPLFTVVESTFPVHWATVGEFFGRAHFAKIRGAMVFVQAWGSVTGPVVAGAIYDRTQSYSHLLWGLVGVLLVVSCLYTMVIGPSPQSTYVKTKLRS